MAEKMASTASVIKTEVWGGNGGTQQEPEMALPSSTILKKITVRHGAAIDAISYSCYANDVLFTVGPWGGSGGTATEIYLEPWEYLTSLSGTYGELEGLDGDVVTSLTFTTSKCTYGPFGQVSGTSFSISTVDGQIIGFHGRTGDVVDAVGIYLVEPEPEKKASTASVIKTEVWGGNGGTQQEPEMALPSSTILKKITVRHGAAIDAISYACYANDVLFTVGPWGGSGGTATEIYLGPWEYLTSLSGTYGGLEGLDGDVVTSLTFTTTKHTYGPFGQVGGTSFSISMVDGQIIGFHGRTGMVVDAIGIFLAPIESEPEKIAEKKASSAGVIKTEVWGGNGGTQHDPEMVLPASTILKTIKVRHGAAIDAISYVCYANDVLFTVGPWGGSGGTAAQIYLEPWEYLTSLSGTYGGLEGLDGDVVTSLTFTTSKRTYGPFGQVSGTAFSISMVDGQIIGFHGRTGEVVDAVGIYLAPIGPAT